MQHHQHMALIGFMGVGKTSIGKQLAMKVNRPFIDTDEEIETHMNMSIMDIFSVYGESVFRSLEKKIIITACKQHKPAIISLGGGAFLSDDTRITCLSSYFVVSLTMSFENWLTRMTPFMDSRPLLKQKTLSELQDLFEGRREIYRYCHFQLCLDELTVDEAVMAIEHAYETRRTTENPY